jgi:ATP-dependent DNA helicase PIF1
MSKKIFELLDEIARTIRNSDMPMGGIQVLLVGDFMQLPPVQKQDNKEFCFQSHLWEALGLHLKNGKYLYMYIYGYGYIYV